MTDFARRFWDASYADGDDLAHWGLAPPGPGLERALEGLTPARTTVLDIGCGTAGEVRWLRARGVRAFGVDLSLSALARARAAGKLPLAVATAFSLPVRDAAAGLVLDAGCLHAIGSASRPLWAKELARVVAPGGALLVRGAARDDDEEGLRSVAPEHCRRWLEPWFDATWSAPVRLTAPAGDLEAVASLWTRRPAA